MIKVKLYTKKLKNNKTTYYLDFYPGLPNPSTGKSTRREHLGLYLFDRPKNEAEKEHNRETKLLAETIRAERQIEVQAGAFGFVSNQNKRRDFLAYFGNIVDSKKTQSVSTHENWASVKKYLDAYANGHALFSHITEAFCEGFKSFLLFQERISHNTAATYFDKFKAAVRDAHHAKLLSENPARGVKSIKPKETRRAFLSEEELKLLAQTPLEKYENIKRAVLFAGLTGLRFSDIAKLKWGDIQHSDRYSYYLCFDQQKTGQGVTHYISNESVELLGDRCSDDDLAIPGLNYSTVANVVPAWAKRAGIGKRITFHALRHTYATVQLSKGTDIYVLMELLGHRDVKTTQIYAHVIDERRHAAANRVTLK